MSEPKPYDAFPNAPGLAEEMQLTRYDEPLTSKFKNQDGKLFRWLSICSKHRDIIGADCKACQVGRWVEASI